MFGNKTPYLPWSRCSPRRCASSSRAAGRYTIEPTDTGVDGVVRGEILAITLTPVGFTEQQHATPLPVHRHGERALRRRDEQTTLWENPNAVVLGRVRAGQPASAGLDRAAFLDQERAAIDRLSTDLARSVVCAILEAF